MEKIKVIERAKFYSEQLLLGIEPVSGIKIAKDNPYNTEKMRKYFEFVSDILGEILDNNGLVSLPSNQNYDFKPYLEPFDISDEDKKKIYISNRPIKPVVFVRRINEVIDRNKMMRFSTTTLNRWLVDNKYLDCHKEPTIINKTFYNINSNSRSIGLRERKVENKKTGEVESIVLLSKDTQEFILRNLDKIK